MIHTNDPTSYMYYKLNTYHDPFVGQLRIQTQTNLHFDCVPRQLLTISLLVVWDMINIKYRLWVQVDPAECNSYDHTMYDIL